MVESMRVGLLVLLAVVLAGCTQVNPTVSDGSQPSSDTGTPFAVVTHSIGILPARSTDASEIRAPVAIYDVFPVVLTATIRDQRPLDSSGVAASQVRQEFCLVLDGRDYARDLLDRPACETMTFRPAEARKTSFVIAEMDVGIHSLSIANLSIEVAIQQVPHLGSRINGSLVDLKVSRTESRTNQTMEAWYHNGTTPIFGTHAGGMQSSDCLPYTEHYEGPYTVRERSSFSTYQRNDGVTICRVWYYEGNDSREIDPGLFAWQRDA